MTLIQGICHQCLLRVNQIATRTQLDLAVRALKTPDEWLRTVGLSETSQRTTADEAQSFGVHLEE